MPKTPLKAMIILKDTIKENVILLIVEGIEEVSQKLFQTMSKKVF